MKKSFVKTLIILSFIFSLCLVSSCNPALEPSKIYNIKYNLDGGVLENAVTTYDGSEDLVLDVPYKDGFEFDGWYTNQEFLGEKVVVLEKGRSGDVTLYAKWKEHQLEIPSEYNRYEFNGNGMQVTIKVLPVSEYDPFDDNYTKDDKVLMQAKIKEIEAAYNIKIVYSAWDNEAPWGIERIRYIKNSFIDGTFKKNNVYAINISSQWIPSLVKASCIAELYNTKTQEGIMSDYVDAYTNISNDMNSIRNNVYGYTIKGVRPDTFLYYNVDKVNELQLDDPTELWFKGEWTWSKFDEWVKEANTKLEANEYVIDCSYYEFVEGAAASIGNPIVNGVRGTVLFDTKPIISIFEQMKSYYTEGYWDTKHGIQDVSRNFINGKNLLHSGKLWYLNEETRFTPSNIEGGVQFQIGVVPYPLSDETSVSLYTSPYTYFDQSGNEVSVDNPVVGRNGQILQNDNGDSIYGINLSSSNYLIPVTGSNDTFAVINYNYDSNGINQAIIFNILYDLYHDETVLSDESYQKYLEDQLIEKIDVAAVMSVQNEALMYYEMIETISLGLHNTFSPVYWQYVCCDILESEKTPEEYLKELIDVYRRELESYQ